MEFCYLSILSTFVAFVMLWLQFHCEFSFLVDANEVYEKCMLNAYFNDNSAQ